MFDIFQSIRGLSQPCLLRPAVKPGDCDLRKRLFASIDNLFREQIAAEMGEPDRCTDMSDHVDPRLRWLITSGMQKAIRRGRRELARRFAMVSCRLDCDHTFRRLAICGIEDVGIGNLAAVGKCLAAAGDRKFRHHIGVERLAGFLAEQLAGSPKSRLACECLSIIEDLPTDQIHDWSRAPNDMLSETALNRSLDLRDRMLAAWLLSGTHRFRGPRLPIENRRDRMAIADAMDKSRMPLILSYLADRSATRTSDAMFVSILPIWQNLQADEIGTVAPRAIGSSVSIGGISAEAIDCHTREGRRAIEQLGKHCPIVRRELAHWPAVARRSVLQNAVFHCEGGLLDRELHFSWSPQVRALAVRNDLSASDLIAADIDELLRCVKASLPQLNEIRSAIMKTGNLSLPTVAR